MLARRGVARIEELTAEGLLALAPRDSQDDIDLAASVRSLARYFTAQDLLLVPPSTPAEDHVASYVRHLDHLRGLATSTRAHHGRTAAELLAVVGFEGGTARLRAIGDADIEGPRGPPPPRSSE